MKSRALVLITAVVLAGLTACSSTTAGTGTGRAATETTQSASASAAAPSTSPAPTITASQLTQAPTTAPTTRATSSHVATTASTSTAPTGSAEILSVEASSPCAGATTGIKNATLTWTSKNATQANIAGSVIATGFGDPKTTGTGPLPPNGSKVMPFDCGNAYYYYSVTVYNSGNTSHSGQVKQFSR
jgi:hypothetical protein